MTDEDAFLEAGAALTGGARVPTPPLGARRRLAGPTAGMAVGTTLSRITGVGRVVALTAALSGGGFADAYNLANTTPNIITDIVIGGVLAATFVPVFVSELTTKPAKEAWEAISSVVTVTVTVVIVATIAFFVLTPSIIDLYTITNHHADVHQQRIVATFLLRWFVPQLACYGLIALFSALLNTQGKFAAPMFVPIANNLVVIAMLVWFHALVPTPTLANIHAHHAALVLLGIGTTLGVVVQAALLVPSLLRSDLRIRLRWQPGHEAMRRITRLAGWTFGIVLSNQVALVVVLALADGARVPGAVSAYTYAYTFFQLPYGVVAVSVMSAVTPSLSARWTQGNIAAFRHRMAFGLRSILAIIIPSAVGMIILAHPLIDLILDHGAETSAQASTTATTLAMFSFGLPGFCTFLYMVRVLQSMQDTRTAFRIYLVENAVNIVLGVALVGPLGVRGLAISVSVAYTVAALISLRVVARKDDGLGGQDLVVPVTRVLVSTAVMAVATVLAVNVSGATSGFALLGRVVLAVVVGAVAFAGATAVLGAREARRRPGGRSRPTDDPAPTVGPPAPPDPDADDPRDRAGRSSIRLVAPGDDGTDEAVGDHDRGDPGARRSAIPFRGRLGGQPDRAPARHLRPVPGKGEDPSPDGTGGTQTTGGHSVVEPGAQSPPEHEE
ncbi:MAG: murein biosynthesis integral membrane protein MurJ [Acidimicrobiales bacterium]